MNPGASKWVEFDSRRFRNQEKVYNLYVIVSDILSLPFLTFRICQNTAHLIWSGDESVVDIARGGKVQVTCCFA
jgi:hypothetical protein